MLSIYDLKKTTEPVLRSEQLNDELLSIAIVKVNAFYLFTYLSIYLQPWLLLTFFINRMAINLLQDHKRVLFIFGTGTSGT